MERFTCSVPRPAHFVHFSCPFYEHLLLPVWQIESSHTPCCLHVLYSISYLHDILLLRKHGKIDLCMEKMHMGKENSNHHRNLPPNSICGLINDATASSGRIAIAA